MKAPQFILYVVFLICSSFLSKAQFISIDEARHKEVKKAEKAGLLWIFIRTKKIL
jgi:hypothetical protein